MDLVRGRAAVRAVQVLIALAAIAICALASGASAAGASLHTGTSSRTSCADVIFIGARGSGEAMNPNNGGMGPSVFHMAKRMRARLANYGDSMDMSGLRYPALGVETLYPSAFQIGLLRRNPLAALVLYKKRNFDKFIGSIDDGTAKMKQAIADFASGCPDSDLILGGYSQGAMVIHQAMLQLEASDSEAGYAVVGSLLLADGDRAAGSRARLFGNAPRRGEGIRTYFRANNRRDVPDPELTASICDNGDVVCDFDRSAIRHPAGAIHTHTAYLKARVGVLDDAVDWLARELFG